MNAHLKIVVGLALLTIVTLGRVVQGDFISSDDPSYVYENVHVVTGLSQANMAWAFSNLQVGFYIPVTFLSLQADASLFGAHAWGFHLTNLILYLASVLLLYLLIWKFTARMGVSFMVAGLFAVHPMHVESVAWITERKDMLSGFFFLLMLLAYERFVQRPGWRTYGPILGLYLLGLWSKPMLVTAPALMLLLDYWPLKRQTPWRRLLLEKAPLLAMGVTQTLITISSHERAGAFLIPQLTWPVRTANAIESVGWYVLKTFIPWNLGVFYPYNALTFTSPSVLASLAMIAVCTVFVWRTRHRHPELLFGWAWFLIAVSPILGIVAPLADTARGDRFVYIAHIGLFLGVVSASAKILPQFWQRSIGAVLLVVLAGLSYRQAGYWRDTQTLYEHTLEVTQPDNFRILYTLANQALNRNELDQAEAYLLAARTHPFSKASHLHLEGNLALKRGQTAEAIQLLIRAQAVEPNNPRLTSDLALAHMHLNQFDKAVRLLEPLQQRPFKSGENCINLGMCYLKLNRPADAVPQLQKAVTLLPGSADAHFLLGMAYVALGRPAEAVPYLERAVDLNPNDQEARQNLMNLRK